MTDFSTLTAAKATSGSIASWVNDDTIPSTIILTDAQKWIYRKLRVREFVTSTTGTLTASATNTPLPDRYLAAMAFKMTSPDTYDLTRRSIEQVDAARAYDGSGNVERGAPMDYAVAGTMAEFAYANDVQRTWFMRFYQQPAMLSTATETNYLTEQASYLLKATCLLFANEWLKDDSEKQYWRQVAEAEVSTLMVEDDREKHDIDVMVQFDR